MPPVERRDEIPCPKCGELGVYVQAHMDVLCQNDTCDFTATINEYDPENREWPDYEDSVPDSDEQFMLNKLTGRVHEYNGSGLGRPLRCSCEQTIPESDLDHLILITWDHVERGIWEPAPCVEERL